MKVFLKYYQPISLQDVILHQTGKKILKKPSFHLTFDDGLANFYDIIAPILLEKKILATIFLNTSFVDNKEIFYRYKASLILNNSKFKIQNLKFNPLEVSFNNKHLLDEYATKIGLNFNEFLKKEKPYLSLEQIKNLQKQGFTFGTHSCNHPKYSEISLEEQIKQTKDSLQWIKDNLNEKNLVFSFPFHDLGITKQFFSEINNDVKLTFGTSGLKTDEITTNLHRLDMEKATISTELFLTKSYSKLLIQQAVGKHKIKRN